MEDPLLPLHSNCGFQAASASEGNGDIRKWDENIKGWGGNEAVDAMKLSFLQVVFCVITCWLSGQAYNLTLLGTYS